MLDRVTSGHAPNRPADITAPSGLIINDVSDSGIAIAWGPLSNARSYTVARDDGIGTGFMPVGSVSEASFADMGLRPATTYSYRVTVTLKDGTEGPNSPIIPARTLPVPPRCDTPGSCAIP
jgi:hypothetical protein